jgi:hypothetical protein
VTQQLRVRRTLAAGLAILALLWCVATAGLYAAMRQAPETFGAIMSYVPGPAMSVLPFEPLWNSARGGHLQVGDEAPDFALPVLHGDRVVRLSEEYRRKPVVLVFGSYT